MAVGLASAIANSLLDALCNGTNYTALTQPIYIQLHKTAEPGPAGTSNVAGNTTRKSVSFGAASGGVCSNDVAITWSSGEVTASEDYLYYTLWTASSGGTFIGSGSITANQVTAGDTFTIAVGDLDLSFTVAT